MTRFLKGTDRPLAEAYELALLDLDGVVYRGKNPVEYAADSIRAAERAGMTIEYTTNNSSRSSTSWPTSSRASDWTSSHGR